MPSPIRYLLLAEIDLGSESADDLRLSVSLPSAVVGVAYTGALIASGGLAPYLYDDTPAGTLPPGLTIDDTTGAVTGTPSAVGYYEFTAAVTDANADTAAQVVSIRVQSGIAFSGSFASGEVGIAYSDGLSASGGTPPYAWTVPSGTLPGGLGPINSSTGVIAGTPTTPGTYNFTVRATDNVGNPQDFPTSITIAAALDLSTSNYPGGFVGTFYNAGPSVIGGIAPISYAISSGAIPAGTNFSPSTGFVTGTPTTAATYTFDVTGTDSLGGSDTFSASVTITDPGGGTTTVTRGPGCMFDGGGSALAGTITRHIEIPYALTITGWTIVADTTGDASIAVKHATYSAFPTMTTLFTATMTGAQKNQATGLSHVCAAGDILQFVGSGFSALSVCAITLNGEGN